MEQRISRFFENGSCVDWSDAGEETVARFKSAYGEECAIFIKCDVSSQPDLKDAFQKAKDHFGSLNIVVNNAAIQTDDWNKVIDINLKSVMHGTLLGIEHMRKDEGGDGGVVVNMSSIVGIFPAHYNPAYGAAKHGIMGFTKSCLFKPEYSATEVKLHVICPGPVNTPLLQPYIDRQDPIIMPIVNKCGTINPNIIKDGMLKLVTESRNGLQLIVKSERTGQEFVPFVNNWELPLKREDEA